MSSAIHNCAAKRAALYARTSQDSDDAYSLLSQLAAMREYAQSHGIMIVHEFREEFTGTKIDRPELNKVRQLMTDKAIDVLIIYRADRLARMQYIAGYLLHEELFPNNVELHVVSFGGRIRPGTRDVLIFNIESAISQDERDIINERMQRGKRNKLMGSDTTPPAWIGYGAIDKYGYKKHGKIRTTHYTIVEEEAEIIRRIFALYAQGVGVSAIVRQLDAQGAPPPSHVKGYTHRKGSHWQLSTITRMLRDTTYIGIWYANRHEYTQGHSRRRSDGECVRLDFPHLRIVDDEVFTKVQELMDARREQYKRKGLFLYLMSRRIRCACGYAIQASTTVSPVAHKPRSYYYCFNRLTSSKTRCQMPYVRTEILDAKVWECISQLLCSPDSIRAGLVTLQQEQRNQHAELVAHMQNAREIIDDCERRLSIYADQEAEGLISRQMLRARKGELDARSQNSQRIYDEYTALLRDTVITDNRIKQVVDSVEAMQPRLLHLDTLELTSKRTIIEELDITGTMGFEEQEGMTQHVLYLFLYGQQLARIALSDDKPLPDFGE